MSLVGQSVSNYEIVRQLGAGGMGVVYHATDTKLGRDVALKFLPPDLGLDEEANERFLQEARAASALNHPNVCVLHDIKKTEDGRFYLVMPFYDGTTLKYLLKDGPLTTGEALDIGRQIADGLSAAHSKGITHRDIKPANIMVTRDLRAVILDFGLAKLTGGLDLTRSGRTLGTVYYMSPEQIRAETVDRRTDLWSLGVVLFELLTGRRPFEGDYEQAVAYSILNSEPLSGVDLPPEIKTILQKLLSKEPTLRFRSAEEVYLELGRAADQVRSTSGRAPHPVSADRDPVRSEKNHFLLGKRTIVGIAVILALAAVVALLQFWSPIPDQRDSARRTVAVLPFTNLRSDPESDYLSYAMADQVIGSLSYVNNLNVRPASSVRQYEHRQYDPIQAGVDLKVDYVLVGNYLHHDGRMRLTVEMVDVKSNEIVWKEPIEVGSNDVFAMQDIVSETVLDRLQVSLSDAERGRMRSDVSSDPLAYEYYLRAVAQPRTREANLIARDLLEKSIELDSAYAPAWSQLGFRRHQLGSFGMLGTEVSRSAEGAFEKALELNPDLISALVNLSTFYTDTGQTDRAYDLAIRVLEVNDNHALAHFARGYVLRYAGMLAESEREMRIALSLDSTDSRLRSAGHTFNLTGDYEDALAAYTIDQESPYYYTQSGEVFQRMGEPEKAIEFYRKAREVDPSGIESPMATAFMSPLLGEYDIGVEAIKKVREAGTIDAEQQYYIAAAFCYNREVQTCNEELRKAVEMGYFNVARLESDFFLDSARGTPEFEKTVALAREKHLRFKAKYFSS